MSLLNTIKAKDDSKVPNSQFIKAEEEGDSGDTKPAETTNPDQAEAK